MLITNIWWHTSSHKESRDRITYLLWVAVHQLDVVLTLSSIQSSIRYSHQEGVTVINCRAGCAVWGEDDPHRVGIKYCLIKFYWHSSSSLDHLRHWRVDGCNCRWVLENFSTIIHVIQCPKTIVFGVLLSSHKLMASLNPNIGHYLRFL